MHQAAVVEGVPAWKTSPSTETPTEASLQETATSHSEGLCKNRVFAFWSCSDFFNTHVW